MAHEMDVFQRIEDAEAPWRALETTACASPFQHFSWVASYLRTMSAANGAEPAIVLIRDAAGNPAVILPFERLRRGGITMLRSIGGKHASFHLPLATSEGEKLIAADPAALLRLAAEAAGGADLIMLTSAPTEWQGRPNPLAGLGAVEAASRAYETELPKDAEAFIQERCSADTRKKLRKKRQGLAKLGAVMATRPGDEAGIGRTLDAFFAQKERRFAAQGLPNPFAEATTQAFLREACAPSGSEGPAIELYGLSCSERIVAVFGLATGFGRASGMFTSFDDDPVIARCSPGDILLQDMVRDLVARGFERFDLGVGEARYKNSFCTAEVTLADAFIPLTLYGRLAAAALQTASRMKAAVKRDPRLLNAANRLRTALRRSA
ncbi:Acetyltransferase involved in cellulose biosynthesis, CelD/BcsL family [Rhizobiales bacterium GAS113]|nr:Acetyltransferase involved in cellulose biosynthesis, CelD/BcsL family [Rhizobiales bacterium GAS113]